jgi:hypothetical protein
MRWSAGALGLKCAVAGRGVQSEGGELVGGDVAAHHTGRGRLGDHVPNQVVQLLPVMLDAGVLVQQHRVPLGAG